MRATIWIWVREGKESIRVPAILWINETPPECRRGKNSKMKNRRYKQAVQARLVERAEVDELTGGGWG